MAERTVSLRAQVGDIDPDAAFATLRDFHSYSEHVDVVREISIGVDAEGNQTSSWSVYFRSGLLEWTERDLIDEATRTMTFEQVTGDLARFDGAWQVSTGDDGVTIAFDAVVDLGIPSLADMLDPLAERALRTNMAEVLRGLFGADIRFVRPDADNATAGRNAVEVGSAAS
ncbi:MAG TPA: SRPBCC family protein [Nocardia sp.]|uniref:SRPBCC family protein n=1 Tax=Nocardia TaxID=1817 RepID=UPI0024555375|nr:MULTISPECIES: SRPBCC family protein [Nocardia]HLS75814.1 SRPBCC family protein [Nocardia sp.]